MHVLCLSEYQHTGSHWWVAVS